VVRRDGAKTLTVDRRPCAARLQRSVGIPRSSRGCAGPWSAALANGGLSTAPAGDGWFLGCKAFAEGRPNTQPQLYGMAHFCSGVVHGLVAVGPLLPANLQFCPPQASNPSQLARVVVQYIEAEPQRMHEDFRQLTLEAFHDAWPCKSGR
jgi:hypothetical protein